MPEYIHYSSAIVTWLLAVVSITTGNNLNAHNFILPVPSEDLHLLWVFAVATQAIFLFEFFNSSENAIKQHFFINNVLLFAWYWLLKKSTEALALVAAVLLLANSTCAYFRERTYEITPVRKWTGIHIPVVAVSLIIGLYLSITHAWSVLNLPHKLLGLHSENVVLIVHLLLVGALLAKFADWGVGLLGAFLALSISSSHSKHNIDAYGGITGVILLVASIYLAYNRNHGGIHLRNSQAPLLS